MVSHGVEEFFVVLPGCKATVRRETNDEYLVVNLVLDDSYFEAAENATTGMYRATKNASGWLVRDLKNGNIGQGEDGPNGHHQHIIGISDRKYPDAKTSVSEIAPLIAKTPGGGSGLRIFDIHYTAGKASGPLLKRYKNAIRPLANEGLNGSAILLARSMYEARKIENLSWVSEFGGSAVLTQAMKILADRGVTLNRHQVYLYRPKSSPDAALTEANRLGIKLERNFMSTLPLDYVANRDQFKIARKRAFNNEDSYTLANGMVDVSKQVGSLRGGAASAVAGLSLLGVGVASGGSIPALIAVGKVFAGVSVATKLADTAAEQFAPRIYHKHIGKIK